MNSPRRAVDVYTLVLLAEGGAELLSPRGNQVWASDSDESFLEEFAERQILDEDDAEDVYEYLEDEGYLTEREAAAAELEIEAAPGPGDDEDDDEDDEELTELETEE